MCLIKRFFGKDMAYTNVSLHLPTFFETLSRAKDYKTFHNHQTSSKNTNRSVFLLE